MYRCLTLNKTGGMRELICGTDNFRRGEMKYETIIQTTPLYKAFIHHNISTGLHVVIVCIISHVMLRFVICICNHGNQ